MKALLGKKLGMTQVFDQETGRVTPVTVLQLGPCPVVQVKSAETDGYGAVQLGFGDVRPTTVTLPRRGHFKKAGVAPRRFLREVRVDNPADFKVGQEITVESLPAGSRVLRGIRIRLRLRPVIGS